MKPKFVTRSSAKLAFLTTTSAKVRSYLESSTFTKDECDTLQKPLYKMILPKIGLNQHIPLAFRYAPKCFHGMELRDICTDQGIFQIIHFLQHIGEETQDGKMIICNIECAQIQIGTVTPFLNLPFYEYEILLPNSWIK